MKISTKSQNSIKQNKEKDNYTHAHTRKEKFSILKILIESKLHIKANWKKKKKCCNDAVYKYSNYATLLFG